MRMSDLKIDWSSTLHNDDGALACYGVEENYVYKDHKKTNETDGWKVLVVDTMNSFEKWTVKVPGEVKPSFSESYPVPVRFNGLNGTAYLIAGELKASLFASSVESIEE